jgi:ribosomal protein S18 acetylase RimI-like enzyme
MSSTPKIRKARASDAIPIQQCVAAAYQHYIARIGKPPGPMLDDYLCVIKQHTVYVAEANTIVGVVVLVSRSAGMLLDNIAVHPEHQGKGIGSRLMKLAESEACKQGYTNLDLYTHECMHENLEIYTTQGYRETERKQEGGYNRVYMRKAL